MTNWLRTFIPQLSVIIAPLTETDKVGTFIGTPKFIECIEKVKKALEKAISLNIPSLTSPYVLYTDGSLINISGVLLQNNKLIRLFSSKLTAIEQRYSEIERETLATVKSVLAFRCWIYNSRVHIFTDNRNLTYSTALKTSRTQRRFLLLSEFSFTLNYVKGAKNAAADYFSRRFEDLEENKKQCQAGEKETHEINTSVNLIHSNLNDKKMLSEIKNSQVEEGIIINQEIPNKKLNWL